MRSPGVGASSLASSVETSGGVISDYITIADARRAQIETFIGKIIKKILQATVAFFGLSQGRFAVEVNVAKNIFEF
jgi:hypothetical protein